MYVNSPNGLMFGPEYLSVDTVDKYNSATLAGTVRHFATLVTYIPRCYLFVTRWGTWHTVCIRRRMVRPMQSHVPCHAYGMFLAHGDVRRRPPGYSAHTPTMMGLGPISRTHPLAQSPPPSTISPT